MPNLTRAAIAALEPSTRDVFLWDSELPRFGVKVTPTGRKTFLVRYATAAKANGKFHIGRCSDMTPDQARELARWAFQQVAAGKDPAVERARRSGADAPTVAALAEAYQRDHAAVRKKPASAEQDARNWRLHILPVLGSKRVTEVTGQDVARLHAAIKQRGHLHAANRVLALLSKAFNLANRWGWIPDGSNPCRHVEKFPEQRRERPVRREELAALGAALRDLEAKRPDLWRGINLFWLWVLTGARMREVMTARWDWIDRERGLLLVPDSKTGQKAVRLNRLALARIDALPTRASSPFLFPSPQIRPSVRGKAEGAPMVNPRKTVARVFEAAGVKGMRIHDLRHVFGSVAGSAGVDIRTIADLLGHAQLSTTERYLQGVGDGTATAGDATAAAIAGMMGAKPG